ncbi:MAG: hypothetical protein Q4G67_06685 [Actinomycetia bacterium]|nr:hypothetical protein [Actinomycetes bacterium]MDO5502846.1 hypothetical protein [Actinomycetes bacterium]
MDDSTWGTALTQTRETDRSETRIVTRTALAVGALAVLFLAPVVGLSSSGLSSNSAEGRADPVARTATVSLDVTNRGLFTERDPRVEIDYPGLTVTGARFEPESVRLGSQGQLVIDLEVDCSAPNPPDSPVQGPEHAWDDEVALGADPTLTVTTARPWGRATARVGQGSFLTSTAAMACTPDDTP